MRIAFLCSEYPPHRGGGIGTFTQALGRELVKAGVGVDVVGIYSCERDTVEDDHGVRVWRLRRANGCGRRSGAPESSNCEGFESDGCTGFLIWVWHLPSHCWAGDLKGSEIRGDREAGYGPGWANRGERLRVRVKGENTLEGVW